MGPQVNALWAGLDWADEEHQVCVVDTTGKTVAAFALPHQAEAALPQLVASLVALLRTLCGQLATYRRRIEALFAAQPEAALFDSLPAARPQLAPRRLAHFGTQPGRYESARPLQQLAGAVPVTQQSGKKKTVHFRYACQKDFRNTMHQFAFCSLRQSEWARAAYHRARARGQSHAHALRTVAAQWIKIIHRMQVTNTPYNEAIHLVSLIRHQSPLIAWMQPNQTGEEPSEQT